jgi:hypothetical protein
MGDSQTELMKPQRTRRDKRTSAICKTQLLRDTQKTQKETQQKGTQLFSDAFPMMDSNPYLRELSRRR